MAVIRPAIAPPGAPCDPAPRALAAAAADAPYLARLMEDAGAVARLLEAGPDALLADAIARAAAPRRGLDEGMSDLRRAKAHAHLAIAVADLAGLWPLARVTGAMTAFADAALEGALALATEVLIAQSELAPEARAAPVPGLILIAMGKHGAGELNYSSDIDFSVFFDRAALPVMPGREASRAAVRIAQLMVKALEEITVEGYCLRADLRLRPDPASTPVAVSVAAAEHYYQTLGQNWERAAFIKARPAAGDRAAGAAFLESLKPFVWRRHLDYAAIADIRSIKRQILTHAAGPGGLGDPACDVKLGRGGIRDIELFVQTQQLILGGRNPALRAPGTLAALDALVAAGALAGDVRDALGAAYVFLRGVEHRAQMLEDEQTHATPADPSRRARIARLAGFADLAAFDAALAATRAAVAAADATLFRPEESLADPLGRLAFTGVEDDPETLDTLRRLGFAAPEIVTETIRGWHHGRVRATRAERARELLTALTPRLLRALAAGGAADLAFERFAAFFAGLPAGVQVLALLDRRDALLGRLADIVTLAPRLAELLAAKPATLDAFLDPSFFAPLDADPPERRPTALRAAIGSGGFEAALDAVRRFQREEALRIDVHLLERLAATEVAAAAHAALADACIAVLSEVAARETALKHGPAPGPFAVIGLGKLGGRELAQGSDLDLMLVFDAEIGSGAAEHFARLTQRLITALSAPTAEGGLYEVDMQLRPSGSKGPVAVRLSSFARYYAEEAWTWELQALTRARPIAGDAALGARVMAAAGQALARPRDRARLIADIAEMRARLDRDRPPKHPFDLKLAPGGLMDIEFAAQALSLLAAQDGLDLARANTGEALAALRAAGRLDAADHALLDGAWRLYSAVQLTLRAACAAPLEAARLGAPLSRRLAAIAGEPDEAALGARLGETRAAVRAAFLRLLSAGAQDAGVSPVSPS